MDATYEVSTGRTGRRKHRFQLESGNRTELVAGTDQRWSNRAVAHWCRKRVRTEYRSPPDPAGLRAACIRQQHLADPRTQRSSFGIQSAAEADRLDASRLQSALLSGWQERRFHLQTFRSTGNLDFRCGRLQRQTVDDLWRTCSGQPPMVAGWQPNRVRFDEGGEQRCVCRPCRRGLGAPAHDGAVRRDATQLVSRRTLDLFRFQPKWKLADLENPRRRWTFRSNHEAWRLRTIRITRRPIVYYCKAESSGIWRVDPNGGEEVELTPQGTARRLGPDETGDRLLCPGCRRSQELNSSMSAHDGQPEWWSFRKQPGSLRARPVSRFRLMDAGSSLLKTTRARATSCWSNTSGEATVLFRTRLTRID